MLRRGLIITGIVFFVGLFCWAYNQEQAISAFDSSNLIRFHVIANSDTVEDQALKRKVRDVIITKVGRDFANVSSVEEAKAEVMANMQDIEKIAQDEVKAWGKDYDVQVLLGNFDFPTKSYGNFTLPAGKYEALKVVIGSGQGHNWWCVLFPPLCFIDISKSLAQGESPEVAALNSATDSPPKVEVRSKLVEIIQEKIEQQKEKFRLSRNSI
ncbi:stage II sporulation protein R [Bacillota bacterium LX-D]|nr:stage II sporulation protein R [Bacillota bacterium LX-D]